MRTYFFFASTLVTALFITPAAFARLARHCGGHDSKADARVRIRRAPARRGSAHLVYDILVAPVPPLAISNAGGSCRAGIVVSGA